MRKRLKLDPKMDPLRCKKCPLSMGTFHSASAIAASSSVRKWFHANISCGSGGQRDWACSASRALSGDADGVPSARRARVSAVMLCCSECVRSYE